MINLQKKECDCHYSVEVLVCSPSSYSQSVQSFLLCYTVHFHSSSPFCLSIGESYMSRPGWPLSPAIHLVQQEQKEGRDEEGHACHEEACPIVTHLVYKESWVNERWDSIITMSMHVLSSSVIMGYKECVPLTKDCFLLPYTKLFKNTTGQRISCF